MDTVKLRKCAPALALCVTFGLASCAAFKKDKPEAAPSPTASEEKKDPVPVVDEPSVMLPGEDDGIRMPDMLALPGEGEFRATNPSLPQPGNESGAVISRPPTDPPERIKPPKPETAE